MTITKHSAQNTIYNSLLLIIGVFGKLRFFKNKYYRIYLKSRKFPEHLNGRTDFIK